MSRRLGVKVLQCITKATQANVVHSGGGFEQIVEVAVHLFKYTNESSRKRIINRIAYTTFD